MRVPRDAVEPVERVLGVRLLGRGRLEEVVPAARAFETVGERQELRARGREGKGISKEAVCKREAKGMRGRTGPRFGP